jgi:hypothetical protein
MTHWSDIEVPVLLEMWRAHESGDGVAWSVLESEIGRRVDPVLRTLNQRGLVSGVTGTGGYVPRYGIALTSTGIDRAEAILAAQDPSLVDRARAWLRERTAVGAQARSTIEFLRWVHDLIT